MTVLCLLTGCGDSDPDPEITVFEACAQGTADRDCYFVELEIPDILYGTATCESFALDEEGDRLLVGPIVGEFDFGPHTTSRDEIWLPKVDDPDFERWDIECFFPGA